MRTIGITGGVGAGKSTVLSYLKNRFQADVLEADKIGHLLLEPEGACYQPVVRLLGRQILGEQEKIDRKKVAALVFSSPDLLKQLNGIIHPAVKKYILQEKSRKEKEGKKFLFIEAALFFEDHYDAFCDEVWYIYADEAVRKKRLKDSRQYSEERIQQTMDRQLSEEEFKARCDYQIENNGEIEKTCRQIAERVREYENM